MNNKVLIFVESRYKINRKRIKEAVDKALTDNEITSPVEVSIAVVGDRKMRDLSKKYKGEDKTRNVLSFSQNEHSADGKEIGKEWPNVDGVMRLGDIVLSFPQVIRDASRDEVFVDDKVDELVQHGLLHLLGIEQEH
ncbi:MAG TPA: rRNA maturation RNase YbeY [Patescibacteria group bacterium]|nr:rRNA maturation RNase YbeY [Patescibacteria group bacterium]